MKLDLFDEQKYQAAAATCLSFIKRQFNVSNFTVEISFPKVFDESFMNQTMYGNITSDLSNYRLIDETGYVSLDEDYDYEYEGEVSGSSTSSFVRYYEWTDKEYLVAVIPVTNGRWSTLDVGIEANTNCIKMVYDAEGHCARKYYDQDEIHVRLYMHAVGDTEHLTDNCKIYHNVSGNKFFFSNKAYLGMKICKVVIPNGTGGWSVIGLAGGISNATTGRFPASFLIPEDDPQYDKDGSTAQGAYGYLLNSRTFLYDVGLAFLVLAEAEEYTLCQKMLERLEIEQNSDGSFNFSFDIYIGVLFHHYVRTGSVGWLVWGICYYILKSGDYNPRWLNILDKAGVWICSQQITDENDERYGLLTCGYGSYNMDDYSYNDEKITLCSTEHNCSTLQALFGLSLIFDPTDRIDYGYRASLVKTGLMNTLWNRDADRFYQGVNDPAWALDCATWAGIQSYNCINRIYAEKCENLSADVYTMTGKRIVQGTTKDRYNQKYYSNSTFDGFKPYSDRTPDYQGAPDIVWSEGTLGYILLCMKIGRYNEAKHYMDEMVKLQTDVSNCTGGILYVNATYGELPWEFHVWESMVSSAWMYLLIKNPQCLFPTVCRTAPYCSEIHLPVVPPPPGPEFIEVVFHYMNMHTGEEDENITLTLRIGIIDMSRYEYFRYEVSPEIYDSDGTYACSGDLADYSVQSDHGDTYIVTSQSTFRNIFSNRLGHYFIGDCADEPGKEEEYEEYQRHKAARAWLLGEEKRLLPSDVLKLPYDEDEGHWGWTTGIMDESGHKYVWEPYYGSVNQWHSPGDYFNMYDFLRYIPETPSYPSNRLTLFVDSNDLINGKIARSTPVYEVAPSESEIHYCRTSPRIPGGSQSAPCFISETVFMRGFETHDNKMGVLSEYNSSDLFVQIPDYVPIPNYIDVALYKFDFASGEIDKTVQLVIRIGVMDDARHHFGWSHQNNDDWYIGYGSWSLGQNESFAIWERWDDYHRVYAGYTSSQAVAEILGNKLGYYFLPDFENTWNPDNPEEHEYWEIDQRTWEETLRAYNLLLGNNNRLQPSEVLKIGEGCGWTTGTVHTKGLKSLDSAYLVWNPYDGYIYEVYPENTKTSFTNVKFCSYLPSPINTSALQEMMFFADANSLVNGKLSEDTVRITLRPYYTSISGSYWQYDKEAGQNVKIADENLTVVAEFFPDTEEDKNEVLVVEGETFGGQGTRFLL